MITTYNDHRGIEELMNLTNEEAAEELRKKAEDIAHIDRLSFFRMGAEVELNRHERRKQESLARRGK